MPPTERCRPLLGTTVAVRVAGLAWREAHAAIDAAFQEVALAHRRMSFHDAASDVSRLNRAAAVRPVVVDSSTLDVLRRSLELARDSDGAFDVSVAAGVVGRGLLPAPAGAPRPDPLASWRDIEISAEGRVRFHRPLWIDLGGIAKGYAVDRAVERLLASGARQVCVNAGGDLRVAGPAAERVLLRSHPETSHDAAMIEIENGSIASSEARRRGPHVHGRTRAVVGTDLFVSVVAADCVVADALTKVVLALGEGSAPLLERYGAAAHVRGRDGRWRSLGAVAAAAA